jgi:DNA-directed RNA polymerase subunit E"
MVKELACRKCRTLTTAGRCPECGSTDLTRSWQGIVIVLDPSSEIAKKMDIEKPGKYAIKVR